MANRYGRDIGRRDREGFGSEERDRSHYPRSSGFGSTPFGEDESYFGGSRRYGEGYRGESPRDFDTYGGGNFGRSSAGYSDRGSWLGGYEDDDRYSQGNERSQGWGSGSRQGYQSGGYSDDDRYSSRFSGGRSGGYQSGSGYSGFSERGGSGGRSGNYGGGYEDRYRGRGYGSYGSDYPSSERGYTSGGGYEEGGERGWLDKTADEVSSWFGDEEAARRRQSDMRQGPHRGRGPSGYTRSDERIKEDINDRLTDYDYIDATNINVEVSGGEVVLSGTVDSRYEKRLAEDIAEDCSGVRNVENRIRVSQGTSWASGESHSTSGTTEAPGSINRPATGTATGSTSATSAGGTSSGTQARGKSSSGS
jgi:osmotically-inducible protein OsmY